MKLSAVLLADSFNTTFRPVTLERPKVLMPLAGAPMLEYTLAFLTANGVTDIHLVACSKADQIVAYLRASQWRLHPDGLSSFGIGPEEAAAGGVDAASASASAAGVSAGTCGDGASSRATSPVPSVPADDGPIVHVVSSPMIQSTGDALRELDLRGTELSDPFVLMSGDVIANLHLRQLVDAHRRRRAADPACAMTMVFQTMHDSHSARPLTDSLVIAVNPATGQLLQYDNNFRNSAASVPVDVFAAMPEVALRFDLLDCNVDVCSREIVEHCAANLTFQDLRASYLPSQLGAVKGPLGCTYYAEAVDGQYAARVHCPHTYHSISKDVLNRWTYPFVPDTNLVADTHFLRSERGAYREHGAVIARDAEIGAGTLIGTGTEVGAGAVVLRSVVGRGCKLGPGCRVVDCHVWNGVTVGDGASVETSLLCDGAVLRPRATVRRGCIVSFGVVLGAGVELAEFSRVTRFQGDTVAAGDATAPPAAFASDEVVVGADGCGRLWSAPAASHLGSHRRWTVYPAPLPDDLPPLSPAVAAATPTTAPPPPTDPAALSALLTRLRAAVAAHDVPGVKALLLSVLESPFASTSVGMQEVMDAKQLLWAPTAPAAPPATSRAAGAGSVGDDDLYSEDSFPLTPVTTDSSVDS